MLRKRILFPPPVIQGIADLSARDVIASEAWQSSRSEEHTSELQSQFHLVCRFFFFNDAAPPEISPLPLHAALPISSPLPLSRESLIYPPEMSLRAKRGNP